MSNVSQEASIVYQVPFGISWSQLNPLTLSKEFTYIYALFFQFPEVLLSAEEVQHNLFDLLFKCQSAEVPWRHLLAHSITLHRSLLSVLAACFQVSYGFSI